VRQLAEGNYSEDRGLFRAAPLELRRLGSNLDDVARSVDRRDQALRRALAAKDAMAREVNHRVKNNLQMITSIVSLQASRLTDPEARRLMMQTGLRVGAFRSCGTGLIKVGGITFTGRKGCRMGRIACTLPLTPPSKDRNARDERRCCQRQGSQHFHSRRHHAERRGSAVR
jgi:hypothetical protein